MTRYELKSSGASFSVDARRTGGSVEVSLNGKSFVVKLTKAGEPSAYTAHVGGDIITFEAESVTPTSVAMKINGERLVFQRVFSKVEPRQPVGVGVHDAGDSLVAPMPGRIVRLHVARGQSVKEGDPLMVIESMKMESVLRSNRTATVDEILVTVGDSVRRHQKLVRFRAPAPSPGLS